MYLEQQCCKVGFGPSILEMCFYFGGACPFEWVGERPCMFGVQVIVYIGCVAHARADMLDRCLVEAIAHLAWQSIEQCHRCIKFSQ